MNAFPWEDSDELRLARASTPSRRGTHRLGHDAGWYGMSAHRDDVIALGLHEAAEDRRIAALMREPKNRVHLERRAEVIERLVAEVRRLRAELRCGAEGHPEVRPESLVPCMLHKGHDGPHWSASGCAGGAVEWDTALTLARAERDEARAALARVEALHCQCTTGNCACGGGPGWCHGCDESWPCSTARALAVPEPKDDKPGLPDELPPDLAAEVDRQLDAIDEAKARAAASAANYIIRGAVPEPGEQPKEDKE